MSELTGDVLDLLTEWLPDNDDPARPLIQLATRHDDRGPDVRTVLLSAWSPNGFSFHTDSRSRKCAQIVENPTVSFVAVWPELGRQLVVRGTAERESREALDRAFRARTEHLKELSFLNSPEFAQLPQDERVARWSRFRDDHDLATIAPPSTWTGYLIHPSRVTAWEGDLTTASRRVEWTSLGGGWSRAILPG